jgi:hypothetical protein
MAYNFLSAQYAMSDISMAISGESKEGQSAAQRM